MKTGKATGSSGITADLLKFTEQDSVKRLANVANGLLEGLNMLTAEKRMN